MTHGPVQEAMRQIRQMAARPALDGQSDEELLALFSRRREEEAFAILVRRHGPMVLGLCLRLLRHRQDAEDAFQATFVMLVRKGHTIRRNGAMASWLYRVAFRIALRLKAKTDRRKCVDVLTEIAVENDPVAAAGWRELRPVLDQEVRRLPVKYRTPMILCYLEGKTYDEVARQLGCPKGTVAIRLLRGRALLKTRLLRRGLVAAAGCVGACVVLPSAQAAVPSALAAATVSSGAAISAGVTLTSCVPAGVACLIRETGRTMCFGKASVLCIAAACLAMSGIGQRTQSTNVPALSQPSHPVAAAPRSVDPAPPPAARINNQAIAAAAPTAKPQTAPRFYPALYIRVQIASDEYSADGTSPRRTTRYGGHLTVWTGEEDLAESGTILEGPNDGERTTLLLIRSDRPRAHVVSASGLACRERMLNDANLFGGPPTPMEEPLVASATDASDSRQLLVQTYVIVEQCQVYFADGKVHIVRIAPMGS